MAKPMPLKELPVFDKRQTRYPGQKYFENGAVIPVDKPAGWSSFDVVRYVRNRISTRKVGHAGTLDPLATGLLVLCTGKATKSISQIQEMKKTYLAEITFGATTPSHDAATEISDTADWSHITEQNIVEIIEKSFTGSIEQVPPIYSALKKDGKRMYKLARKGVEFTPQPRTVLVHELNIVEFDLPKIKLEIHCGKGFYVRSLASDLAKAVESLGYLSYLRRLAIGTFSVDHAWETEQINKWKDHGEAGLA